MSKEDLGREQFLQLVWDWKNASEQKIVGQIKKLGLALDWSRMKFTLSDEMQQVVRKVFVALYREGQDLPGHLHGQPLPQLQDGAFRPGGRAQGSARPPDLYPLPAAP